MSRVICHADNCDDILVPGTRFCEMHNDPRWPHNQKPVPAAEMPEGWAECSRNGVVVGYTNGDCWLSTDDIRALLAAQGLRVVPESECLPAPFTVRMISEHGYKLVPPEACRVLEAMARAHRLQLTTILEHDTGNGDPLIEAARAELARREDL